MKYLTGCAENFRIGYIDVDQFTLENVVVARVTLGCGLGRKTQGHATLNARDVPRPV
jgi:hypothetical protein